MYVFMRARTLSHHTVYIDYFRPIKLLLPRNDNQKYDRASRRVRIARQNFAIKLNFVKVFVRHSTDNVARETP